MEISKYLVRPIKKGNILNKQENKNQIPNII